MSWDWTWNPGDYSDPAVFDAAHRKAVAEAARDGIPADQVTTMMTPGADTDRA